MKQEYFIKFQTTGDTKGLEQLDNQSKKTKHGFENLKSSIGSVRGEALKLTTAFLGVNSAIQLAQKAVNVSDSAKGNIIDFKRHSWGSKYAVEFLHNSKKISEEYSFSRDETEKAMYKAVQNRKIFNEDKNEVIGMTNLAARYAKASGGDLQDVMSKLLKLKKMSGSSNDKIERLLDAVTFYEDEDGVNQGELLNGLVDNLEYISDDTDLENVLNLYVELISKSKDQTRANKTLQNILIKRSEIRKHQDNSGNALARIADKKIFKKMGIGIEEWKKMDDAKAIEVLLASIDFENEEDVGLLGDAIGAREALRLNNKTLTSTNKDSYIGNLDAEVQKKKDGEGGIKKSLNFVKKIGENIVRSSTGQEAYDVWKEQNKEEIEKEKQQLRKKGYMPFQTENEIHRKFLQETSQFDKATVNNNVITHTTNITIDGSKSPKETGAEVLEFAKIANNHLEQKLNK